MQRAPVTPAVLRLCEFPGEARRSKLMRETLHHPDAQGVAPFLELRIPTLGSTRFSFSGGADRAVSWRLAARFDRRPAPNLELERTRDCGKSRKIWGSAGRDRRILRPVDDQKGGDPLDFYFLDTWKLRISSRFSRILSEIPRARGNFPRRTRGSGYVLRVTCHVLPVLRVTCYVSHPVTTYVPRPLHVR